MIVINQVLIQRLRQMKTRLRTTLKKSRFATGCWSRTILPLRLKFRRRDAIDLLALAERMPIYRDYERSNVLVASSILGNVDIARLDACLGVRLKRQNANVAFLVCDGSLSACSLCESERFFSDSEFGKSGPGYTCSLCQGSLRRYLEDNFTIFTYGTLATDEQKEIDVWTQSFLKENQKSFHGVDLAEHIRAGIVRFYGRVICMQDVPPSIIERFVRAACLTVLRLTSLLQKFKPAVVIVNHGLYVPQGVVVATCHSKSIRVVTWHMGYRRNSLLLSHGDTYHKQLISESNKIWENHGLSVLEREWLQKYLYSRRTGSQDWISFVHKNAEKHSPITPQRAADKKIIAVLTNVEWDAQAHYGENTYEGMRQWLEDICRCVVALPNHRFIVRIHPAEVTGRRIAATTSADVLRQTASVCPNLTIIEADQPVSTYQLLEASELVIVYATKAAVEAACMQKPVLICGESCLRGKKVGRDLLVGEDIVQVVQEMINETVNLPIDRAERYAYHLFGRRMITWELLDGKKGISGDQVILDGIMYELPFHAKTP